MLGFGIERWLIGVALLLAAFVGTYQTGYWRGWNASEAKWKQLKLEMELASREREAQLRAQGDELAARLKEAQTKVRVETVEVVRYVRQKASTTRACLSVDVVAALNRDTPIRETVYRPQAAPVTVEHKPTPQPAGESSEAAVAEWIANAQAAHEACRAQVAALGDWVRSITRKAP